MVISRCCKAPVYVVSDYYVCDDCHLACATIQLTGSFATEVMDATQRTTEVERFIDSP